jgi:Tfp pilus tip-associated adhesin PilY1
MGFLAKSRATDGRDVYRGYVGDLDGNIWRLDIADAQRSRSMRQRTRLGLHKFAQLAAGPGSSSTRPTW